MILEIVAFCEDIHGYHLSIEVMQINFVDF